MSRISNTTRVIICNLRQCCHWPLAVRIVAQQRRYLKLNTMKEERRWPQGRLLRIANGTWGLVQGAYEHADPAGLAELAKCSFLQLPDALAREVHGLADLFKRPFPAIGQTESQLDNGLLSWR